MGGGKQNERRGNIRFLPWASNGIDAGEGSLQQSGVFLGLYICDIVKGFQNLGIGILQSDHIIRETL